MLLFVFYRFVFLRLHVFVSGLLLPVAVRVHIDATVSTVSIYILVSLLLCVHMNTFRFSITLTTSPVGPPAYTLEDY
jgi:hypothetical protein